MTQLFKMLQNTVKWQNLMTEAVPLKKKSRKNMTEFIQKLYGADRTVYRQSFCKKSYLQIENTDFCLVLQQLSSHICLAKLILSCCFSRAALVRRPKGGQQQERINFAKQMCEESC